MPFVKLDTGILNSTLWFEKSSRDVFLTALLMAVPAELEKPMAQLAIRSLEPTGWMVPCGWYGLVEAAGIGIIHRAGLTDVEAGLDALERLGAPESASRSPEHEGRRLVRVSGGFLVLNYMRYRDRDYTGAERAKRYRQRLASRTPSHRDVTESHRDITQAEYRVQSTDQDQEHGESACATVTKPLQPLRSEQPKPHTSGGAGKGTHPRDHLRHGCCPWQLVPGSTAPCVPDFLHGQFLQQLGQDADRLTEFYRGVAAVTLAPCGDDGIAFWRAHFTTHIGQTAPIPKTNDERRREAEKARSAAWRPPA